MSTREEFESLSSRLMRCPLCGDTDVNLNTHPIFKPIANCNNCGISYQGEDVEQVIKRWNETLPALRQLY